MMLEMIMGIGIVCFLLLYFISQLDKEHILFKVFVAFVFMSLLLLIPKTIVDNNDYCEIVLNKSLESYYYDSNNLTQALNTTNTYSYECFSNSKTTDTIFFNSIVLVYRIFIIYIFVYWTYIVILKKKFIKWGILKGRNG